MASNICKAFSVDGETKQTDHFNNSSEQRKFSDIILTQCKPNIILEESNNDLTGASHLSGFNSQHDISIQDQLSFEFSSKYPWSSIPRKEQSSLNTSGSGLSPLLIDEETRKSTKESESEEGLFHFENSIHLEERQIENQTKEYDNQIRCSSHQAVKNGITNVSDVMLLRQKNPIKKVSKPNKTNHFQDYIVNQKQIIESKLKHIGDAQSNHCINTKEKTHSVLKVLSHHQTERILSFLDDEEDKESQETQRGCINIPLGKDQEEFFQRDFSLEKSIVMNANTFQVDTNSLNRIQPFSLIDQALQSHQTNKHYKDNNCFPQTKKSLIKSPTSAPQVYLFSNPYVSPKNEAKKYELTQTKTPQGPILEKVKQNQQYFEEIHSNPSNQCSCQDNHTQVCLSECHFHENHPLAQTQKKQAQHFLGQPIIIPQNSSITRNNSMKTSANKQPNEEESSQYQKPTIIVKKVPNNIMLSKHCLKQISQNFSNVVKSHLSNYEQILENNQKGIIFISKARNIVKAPIGESHKSDYSKIVNRLYKNLAKTIPRSLVA